MKKVLLFKLLLIQFFFALAQPKMNGDKKPVIDTGMLYMWPYINGDIVISKNGRYIAYTISNQPIESKTLVVQTLNGDWKKQFTSNEIRNEFYFTNDSKLLCFQLGDTLVMQITGSKNTKCQKSVGIYKFPDENRGEWIVYREKGQFDTLVLSNMISGKDKFYIRVKNAVFSKDGNVLLIESIDDNFAPVLQWIDLKTQKRNIIFRGTKGDRLNSFQFDKYSKQLAFLVTGSNTSKVYHFKPGLEQAAEKLGSTSKLLEDNLTISSVSGFSGNGKWLFVKLDKAPLPKIKTNPNLVSVDVWSYKDDILLPAQPFAEAKEKIDMVLSTEDYHDGFVVNPDRLKTQIFVGQTGYIDGDGLILTSDTIESREYWWPHSPKPESWLFSLKDGQKKKLPFYSRQSRMSNTGKWIIYWSDEDKRLHLFSYEVETGKIINITKSLPVSVAMEKMATADSIPVGVAGWYRNDEAILIYDNYDIWKLDPAGKKAPVNLTDGYGTRNNIKFRFLDENETEIVYNGNEKVVLTAYNEDNKYNGFFLMDLKNVKHPEQLTMNPFCWYRKSSQVGNSALTAHKLMMPVEGGKGAMHRWILMGESAKQYPNYFYTKDFRKFVKITAFEPQKDYNWLTTELVTWRMLDGQICQGILYKPENFDSSKKYPIIFNYYERLSGMMYSFLDPRTTRGSLSVPWFVSRGYLVFTPDIYFSIGSETGISSCEHAYNSVVSSAEYLAKLPYIDKDRMGIQGHSFGGLLTNYLLTHSNLFAAAAEGAGFSDEMSSYLTLITFPSGSSIEQSSTQEHKERDHALYGATPWERPDLYRKNSPVWDADKANAPLLIHHNKKDPQVQWRQGVEMYMALRRLGKPCWMLQYDNGAHSVVGKESEDFTIRLTQYFDHYLKGQYPPRWMTEGIPAKLKQVENRLELDKNGFCNKVCRVCARLHQK